MWNDEIKQNIINELNEQFDSISPDSQRENHSYADSIFSISSNVYKPISNEVLEAPNYYETTINRMRTIKEVLVHTIAFADSFDSNDSSKIDYSGSSSSYYNHIDNSKNNTSICDMDQIINSSSAIMLSLTPESRKVAIAKRATWKDILFEDATLLKNTSFAEAVKKFCSIQIKF